MELSKKNKIPAVLFIVLIFFPRALIADGANCSEGIEDVHAAAIRQVHYNTLESAISAARPEDIIELLTEVNYN